MRREVLSSYIEARDNAIKNKDSALIVVSGPMGKMSRFSQMVDQHHQALFDDEPLYTLAEMEALSELVSSRLAWYRMHQNKR